jgi:hypothetical protein
MKRLTIILIIANLVIGCSAIRLHEKAVKKGYVHTIDVDTIKVAYIDTFYEEGKPYPVINYRDSLIIKTNTEYVPRWRTRFDNNRFKDSLEHIRAMYEDSLRSALKAQKIALQKQKVEAKKETKQVKHENKKGANLFLLGLATGIILTIILRYAINQALKKFA